MSISHQRLSLSLATNIIAEFISKIVPIIILSLAQKKLGLEAFGFAQVAIALIEFCIPFISFGYNQWGSIELGKVSRGSKEEGEHISNIVMLKVCHSLLIFLTLIGGCLIVDSYHKYLLIIVSLGYVLFFTAIELLWVQIGTQKLTSYGFFTVISKLLALALILMLVHLPEHAILFSVLSLSANAMTCLGTFLYCFKSIRWQKPSFHAMRRIFLNSKSFALITIYAVFIERIDLIAAERFLDPSTVGIYAGILRINNTILQFIWILGLVLFSESITAKSDRDLNNHIKLSIFAFSTLLAPVCFGVWFVDKELVTLIFDEKFAEYASILSLMIIGNIGSVLILVYGQQVLQIKGAVNKMFGSMIIGMLSFILFLSLFNNSAYAITIAQIISKFIAGIGMIYFAKKWLKSLPLIEAFRPIISASFMATCLYFLPPLEFYWVIIIGAIIYIVSLWLLNYQWFKNSFR